MDIPSPPSIRIYDSNASFGPHRPSSRTSGHSAMSFTRTPGAVSIPNLRHEPPPPLPPPRFIEDFNVGRDPGWNWGNRFNSGRTEKSGTGSVSPGSSLLGNWEKRMEGKDCEEFPEDTRRVNSATTIKSSLDNEMKYDMFRYKDEGYHSLSGSSLANHQLHGERPLERRNLENSSQAYDNKLLSKIGKPKTPPRLFRPGSIDASPTSKVPFFQGAKYPRELKSLSMSDGSLSASSDSPFKAGSPFSKYGDSPQSAVVSPGLLSSATSAKSYMEFRSPTYDGSGQSSAIEPERFSQIRPASQRSGSGSVATNLDDGASNFGGLSSRGSYDQGMTLSTFSEPDTDFPIDETGALRHLHLEDRASNRTPPSLESHPYSPSSRRLGMKRRASSPPPEPSRDDKAPLHSVGSSSELYQRHTSSHLSANLNRFSQHHGSVSSTASSGLRNSSYASSGGLSHGGSSITSFSSHERLSPRGISPLPDQHTGRDSPYVTSISLNPSPRESLSRPHQRTSSESKPSGSRKMSSDSTGQGKLHNAPKLQANVHICECCPKKPKKFDSLEELHIHESEKQYTCSFCHNRFKNKNEAERHQNSLHLRRHSWSCATLGEGYQAAFHPSTSIPSSNSNSQNLPLPSPDTLAAYDVCGYCGEEFSNEPAPDYDARMTHLTNVHKFGECNQSKKFFRADHFRQHLKHSHAGTSGKWTNMLENACMRDEPPDGQQQQQQQHSQQQQQPQQPQLGAPVANMGVGLGRGGNIGMGMGIGMMMPGASGLRELKIEEMHEEP